MILHMSLENRPFYIAAFSAGAAWCVLAFIPWSRLTNGVYVGWPTRNIYGLGLLFQGHIEALPVICVVLLNLAAATIGYTLILCPIWGDRALISHLWLFVAGVVPGAILTGVLARVATLFLPNEVAPGVILTMTFAAALVALVYVLNNCSARKLWPVDARSLGAVLIAVSVALIFEVEFDQFHVAGEAILFFIRDVFLSASHGIGAPGHWPLFSQHYDEAAFLYPVVYGLVTPGSDQSATLIVLYWISLALGRLGVMVLAFTALRSLGLDKLSAFVVLAFFTAGSLSLNPLSSHILFDSLSPLGYALHVSRIIVPLMPMLMVSAADALDSKRPSGMTLVVAALLGVGLASMTIHIALALMWIGAVLIMARFNPSAARSALLWRAACTAAVIVLLGFTVSYGARNVSVHLLIAALLIATVAASLVLCGALLRVGRVSPAHAAIVPIGGLRLWIMLGGGYLAGVLLLGNVLAHWTQGTLSTIWPWSEVKIVERFSSDIIAPIYELMQSPYCSGGYSWGYGRILTGHCGSVPMLVRTYGLAPILMTFVFAWMLYRGSALLLTLSPRHTLLFWGAALSLVALPLMFVPLDFVTATNLPYHQQFLSMWLRSRFIEPWFYSGSLLALTLYFPNASCRGRRALQAAMLVGVAVFGLSPLLLPAQFMANIAFLLSALTGI
jgi:hypothetical protein